MSGPISICAAGVGRAKVALKKERMLKAMKSVVAVVDDRIDFMVALVLSGGVL